MSVSFVVPLERKINGATKDGNRLRCFIGAAVRYRCGTFPAQSDPCLGPAGREELYPCSGKPTPWVTSLVDQGKWGKVMHSPLSQTCTTGLAEQRKPGDPITPCPASSKAAVCIVQ